MPRFSTANTQSLETAMTDWLREFSGEAICARQIWYECLGGYGVPSPEDMAAMHAVLDSLGDWKPIGDMRHEKFGTQYSYKRSNSQMDENASDRIMVQHLFKLNGLYKAPDGKVFKVVLSEVYNLRCFEVVDGNLVGPMVKIQPTSDFAKSLQEV